MAADPSSESMPKAPQGYRRCLHCQTDQTPQWRIGPAGPGTLCNACGVRHRTGRLVPEYRPAASPTFVRSEHSNSHRKVIQLRRHKGVTDPPQQKQPPQPEQQQQLKNHDLFDSPTQSAEADDYLIHHHLGIDYIQLF